MTDLTLALQETLFDTLFDATSAGVRVYDKPPTSPYGSGSTYISFGPSDENEEDAECIEGSIVTQQLDIWSKYTAGFRDSKRLAGEIKKLIHRKELPMTGATLSEIFVRSIRHFRDPDGLTSHGVVEVRALIEAE